MNSKEIELQVLLDNDKWIERILNEDKNIMLNKIKTETNAKLQVRKMRPYELRGKTIAFVK